MRVLFATWAVSSHFNPIVPLGWALRSAGHEVLVACHPSFAPTVTLAGLPALPAGPDFDLDAEIRAEHAVGRWWAVRTQEEIRRHDRDLVGLQAARHSSEEMAGEIVSFARTWLPDLVIYEPTAFVGALVARLLAVPAVRHLWSPDFTAGLGQIERRLLGPLGARFGLTEIGVLGDMTLDPCPPRLEVADGMRRVPIRYVPYNGPAVLPGWLGESAPRRRVCVTWGASLGRYGGIERVAHVPRVVGAMAGLDVEVVVAVPESQREMFAGAPANVRWIGPVPLNLLLPSCDAIIHQGGGGTLMSAMVCGVPQLIVPTMPDQIFDAEQLERTGAGRYLPGGENVTEAAVAEAMGAILGDGRYRDGARRLAAEAMAMPTPADVVTMLEHIAGGAAERSGSAAPPGFRG